MKKPKLGAVIWKVALGAMFAVSAFSLLPDSVGGFFVGLILAAALIAWGLVPWFGWKRASGGSAHVPDPAPASWSVWDSSVHESAGQSARMERAIEQDIRVLDSGKGGVYTVRGSTGYLYRTSFGGCTCEDFQRRGLPCKHMYKLAMERAGFDPALFMQGDYQ